MHLKRSRACAPINTASIRKKLLGTSLSLLIPQRATCAAGEEGPAVSSGQGDPTPAQRGQGMVRSIGEGNSWEGSGVSPGFPEQARHVDESAPKYDLPLAPVNPTARFPPCTDREVGSMYCRRN